MGNILVFAKNKKTADGGHGHYFRRPGPTPARQRASGLVDRAVFRATLLLEMKLQNR
jgi:hypothetical protein